MEEGVRALSFRGGNALLVCKGSKDVLMKNKPGENEWKREKGDRVFNSWCF